MAIENVVIKDLAPKSKLGVGFDDPVDAVWRELQWKTSGDMQNGLEAARILGCRVLSPNGR